MEGASNLQGHLKADKILLILNTDQAKYENWKETSAMKSDDVKTKSIEFHKVISIDDLKEDINPTVKKEKLVSLNEARALGSKKASEIRSTLDRVITEQEEEIHKIRLFMDMVQQVKKNFMKQCHTLEQLNKVCDDLTSGSQAVNYAATT